METEVSYDGPLTVRQSDWLGDWWMIEKSEHENESGIQWKGGAGHYWHSARISDADIEGPGHEMRAIAEATLRGESAQFRRCAVELVGDRCLLWSPRNSQENGIVPRARAEELARHILDTVSLPPPPQEG